MIRRLLTILPLCLVVAAVPTVLQPLASAVVNWNEISADFSDLLRLLLPLCALTTATLAALAILGQRLAPLRAPALLAALAIALTVQGHFLVWDYGSFDGTPIDWRENRPVGALELATWGVLVAIALLRPTVFAGRTRLVAAGIAIFEILSLAFVYLEHAPLPSRIHQLAVEETNSTPAAAMEAKITLLSKRSNVLIVVLDMFQSDFFSEALRDPTVADRVPPGFTYYRNAISPYQSTSIALQSTLTSRELDPTRRLAPWLREQMPDSLPAALAARGFQSGLLSISPQNLSCWSVRHGYSCFSPETFLTASEAAEQRSGGDLQRRLDARAMLGTALFRLAPHFAKPAIHDGTQWSVGWFLPSSLLEDSFDPRISLATRRDLEVFRILQEETIVADVAPAFRLLHFQAAHTPNTVTSTCDFDDRPTRDDDVERRRRAVGAATCSLRQLFGYLERLQEVGAYDNSLIFVVADHGMPKVQLDPRVADPPLSAPRAARRIPLRLGNHGRGVPLFLAKRARAQGPLRVSDSPVSLCDIPRSVATELSFAAAYACESIFELGETRRSPRRHYRFQYGSHRTRPPYAFDVYDVEGHSWWAESWHLLRDSEAVGGLSERE